MPPSSSAPRSRFVLALLAVSLCSALLFAGLGLLEAGLRVLAPQRGPELGFKDDAGLTRILADIETVSAAGEFRVEVRTDEDGRRYCSRASPSGSVTPLVVIGDSFAFGWGVPGDAVAGCRIAGHLGHRLINLAVPGDGPKQQALRLAEFQGDPESPAGGALLLFAFGGNDLDDLERGEANLNVDWEDGSKEAFRFRLPIPFKGWLQERSHAYMMLSRGWSRFLIFVGARTGTVPFSNAYLTSSGDRYEGRQVALERAYEEVATLTQAAGRRGIVAYIPASLELDPALRERLADLYGVPDDAWDLHHPKRRFERAAGAVGLEFLDLSEALRAHPVADVYYLLDGHWTEFGHRVVSEFLLDHLE